jgi:hypothetical protein
MPADSFVGLWQFIARRNICVAPACVKPPPRYTSVAGRAAYFGRAKKRKISNISLLKNFSCFCGYKQEKIVPLHFEIRTIVK